MRDCHHKATAGPAASPARPQGFDAAMMALALALAGRALGSVWPNPAVGAVIADPATGAILGCGATAPGGRPHAEVLALRQAGERARGATLYVTLEPCSHWGKSPPCADAVIAAGVSRVVYGAGDPNPLVAGRGLARLAAAGVEAAQGPFAEEARWLALGHILKVTEGRPFVQLKLAVGSDGLVPVGNGRPVWVTGNEARAIAHLYRAQADAIATGRGTVEADDPELTCRLPGMDARSPLRVVFDSGARLSPHARLFAAIARAPIWVFRLDSASTENIARLEARGASCLLTPADREGRLDVHAALRQLAERGITRLLVEGGPTLAGAFLRAGVVDEILVFEGSVAAGEAGLAPFAGQALDDGFVVFETRSIGGDRLRTYRRREPFSGGR
jgi:diaminohydroxyphosphoribosylaminopyrimidine deaminase/5-amino-6-(5-phosphoribosylamino)uracil reductase